MVEFTGSMLHAFWNGMHEQGLHNNKEICSKYKFSYTNFSRHMNGQAMELDTLLRYFKAAKVLPPSKFIMPHEDWETFKLVNNLTNFPF